MTFTEIDCFRCPKACFNFQNETLPSYTMVYGDLLMSVCPRPIKFEKAMNYVYDYMPKKYKKKKNFTIGVTHCEIIYPELKGIELFPDNFDEIIKGGFSYVL